MTSLANASAGHPLRRALPPPPAMVVPPERSRGEDIRLFAMTFVAGFVAFYGMIA